MRSHSTMDLRVWAPGARLVESVVSGRRTAMTRDGEWWVTELPEGTDYSFAVDGGEPRPDPRTRYQPHGVHGPSRVVDLSSFAWTDSQWAGRPCLGEVWYELHVGTFTPEGTLDAAIAKLPHLRDLGVGVVELMPLAPFPGERGWGYDGVSLFAVHEAYGGPRALQRFVDAAHGAGLAVALDVVYNHFGPDGNYLSVFGPYFTSTHSTPWGDAVNLDAPGAHGMRQYVVDNARQWFVDFHVDALRLDAVHALVDESPRHILAELADAVARWRAEVGRPLALVAESDLNDVTMLRSTSESGYGMDGQWADDVHHALHAYLTGETFGYYVDFGSPGTLAKAFTDVFVHDGTYSTFRDKSWGAPVPADADRARFVTFTQNHDQVGNRALGDRPDERLPRGMTMAGAALLLLGPFTPMLFQGQEWGTTGRFQFFTSHGRDLGAAITEGRRAEFASHGWEELYGSGLEVPDPQAESTFLDSKLAWSELADPEHAAVLDGYRSLIALRSEVAGDAAAHSSWGDGWFRLDRARLTVVAQTGGGSSTHRLGSGGAETNPVELAWSWGEVVMSGGVLTLGPHSVAVLRDGSASAGSCQR